MRIENEIDIAAPLEVVWRLTEDIESWPTLTPTITAVDRLEEGPLRVGSTARLKQPGQRSSVWTVTVLEPNRYFEWEARVLGMHTVAGHRLDETPLGCRNTLSLELSGRGAGLLVRVLSRSLRRALAKENAGFRRRAEAIDT